MKKLPFLLLLLLLLTACNLPQLTRPSATPAPTTPPPPLPIPSATLPPPTLQPTLPPTPPQPSPTLVPVGLASDGPWLVFETSNGLSAINASGQGGAVMIFAPQPAQWSVSPRGRRIAILSTTLNETGSWTYRDLLLSLVTFPGGQVRELSVLTNEENTVLDEALPGEPAYQTARAILEQPNLAWSPDGQALAFIGAYAGPSADLYLYDVANNRITRLSDGPSQAFWPFWSPDGRYLVHLGAENFGTGAGYDMSGAWALRMSDRKLFELYTISPKSSAETLLGWRSDGSLVLYSFDPICGYKELRTYHPETMLTTPLNKGYLQAAWAAPDGSILYGWDDSFSEFCNNGTPGLYLSSPQLPLQQTGQPLLPFGAIARWEPALGGFLVAGEGSLTLLQSDGSTTALQPAQPELPLLSPNGERWAWAQNEAPGGVWVGTFNQTPQRIFDGSAHDAIWTPDGTTLFFFGDSPGLGQGLFRASAPNFTPTRVVEALDGSAPAWVLP